jgi:hypothetical protein
MANWRRVNRVGMGNFEGGHPILLLCHFRNFLTVLERHPEFFDPVPSGPIFPELAEGCFLRQTKNHER